MRTLEDQRLDPTVTREIAETYSLQKKYPQWPWRRTRVVLSLLFTRLWPYVCKRPTLRARHLTPGT